MGSNPLSRVMKYDEYTIEVPKSKFEYLDDYPVFVLGQYCRSPYAQPYSKNVVVPFSPKIELSKDREWKYIVHQTNGYSCNQQYILGTILEPKNVQIYKDIHKLSDKWCGHHHHSEYTLDIINEYRNDLKTLFGTHIDCNETFKRLEEAFYPIDLRSNALETLCDIPSGDEFLKSLFRWTSKPKNLIEEFETPHWELFILGENSD